MAATVYVGDDGLNTRAITVKETWPQYAGPGLKRLMDDIQSIRREGEISFEEAGLIAVKRERAKQDSILHQEGHQLYPGSEYTYWLNGDGTIDYQRRDDQTMVSLKKDGCPRGFKWNGRECEDTGGFAREMAHMD